MKTTTRNTSNYAKERDEAMLSLDEKKIRDFCRKHNVSVSDNPIVFWGGVYKTVLAITSCPPEIRKKAEDWLDSHGFHRGITGSPAVTSRPERHPRHTFEHVVLPGAFYEYGKKLQNQVVDGNRAYMAELYSNLENSGTAIHPYKAKYFKILPRKYETDDDTITIVRVELPKPVEILECRRIYLCRSERTNALLYFTSELSMQGTFYLCAWTKAHAHLLLNMDPQENEFDNVFNLFCQLAGYEPPVQEAV